MASIIRLATVMDAEAIQAIYTPIVLETAISFEWVPPSRAEIAGRIAGVLSAQRPWLIYEVDGNTVAYAYASAFRERAGYAWSVESSINVAQAARVGGVGRALYARLLAVLDAQGYRSVFAAIAQPNEPSNALHARAGFRPVGTLTKAGFKLGAWHDVQWWQRHFDETAAEPASIRPLTAVASVLDSGAVA